MKTGNDGAATAPATTEDFVSRKLIRPPHAPQNRAGHEQQSRHHPRSNPAEPTHAETFYYQKQIQARTPLTIVLRNGESFEGVLEWYDKSSLRVARHDGSTLLLFKTAIKYMYKTSEAIER